MFCRIRSALLFAYSDSATDLPMLETVGHPHAVNQNRQLRKAAVARGSPVLEFATQNTVPDGRYPPDPQPVSRSNETVRHVNSEFR